MTLLNPTLQTAESMAKQEWNEQPTSAESKHLDQRPAKLIYFGVILLSAGGLLFELALTRIFSVIVWSNFAFMIVSTALWGFGMSGVYIALRRAKTASENRQSVAWSTLAAALSMVVAYVVITKVPVRIWDLTTEPESMLSLALWEIAVLAPFFFSGVALTLLIGSNVKSVGRLYGVDLLGAALGAGLLLCVIPLGGGERTIFLAALMVAIAALLFAMQATKGLRWAAMATVALLIAALPVADTILPLTFYQTKRHFNRAVKHNDILATSWSPLSRIDITKHKIRSGAGRGRSANAIWIDGGTNASVMLEWSGDIATLEPQNWSSVAAPYVFKGHDARQVLVIGASGGKEVLFALSHGSGHVDAVEMDPSIVRFMKEGQFAAFAGHLYEHPQVTLINDEGRSFLKRQPRDYYDVIQFVNNYTPAAMAAGALNLSEMFLVTKESIKDYWRHLSPDGVLALHRGATLRVALTAVEALRELGIENPEQHIVIGNGEYEALQGFFLKRSAWSAEQVQKMREYHASLSLYAGVNDLLFDPFKRENPDIYTKVLTASSVQQRGYYTNLGVDLSPATDDRPFVEHSIKFGENHLDSIVPPEFRSRAKQKWASIIPRGDLPYIVILLESAILALLFVGCPLILAGRKKSSMNGFWQSLVYFAALGFSFIVVEICLMKRYVLYLGHPAISIAAVVIILLCGAGCGSLATSRVSLLRRRSFVTALALLVMALLLEAQLSSIILEQFLAVHFSLRIIVVAALLFPLGFLMGIPFPLGIQLISALNTDFSVRQKMIAWAWGINGYTTVIGSALSVFIALFYGFRIALAAAALGYLLALAAGVSLMRLRTT